MLVPIIFRRGFNSGHCVKSSTTDGPRFMEETGNRQQKISPRTNKRPSAISKRTCFERSRTKNANTRRAEATMTIQKACSGWRARTPTINPITAPAPAARLAQTYHFRGVEARAMETDATILIFYSESAITSPHLPKTRSCIELSKFKAVWGGRKVSPQPSTERKMLL